MKIPLLNPINVKPSHSDGFSGIKIAITPAASVLKEGIAGKKRLSDCRVLVVDDSPDNAMLVKMYLRNSAKSADMAETASGAIAKIGEAAKNGKYDIVLCDISLDSGKTGFDVEEAAKKLSPGITFVFLSGHDRGGFAQQFPGRQCPSLMVQKPIRKEALLEFLGKLCDGQLS